MANLIKGGQTTQWPTLYRTDNTMANLIKGGQTTQWPTLPKEDRQHNGQPYPLYLIVLVDIETFVHMSIVVTLLYAPV
jgi:hypothetical protein